MNIILKLFNEEYVTNLFTEKVLPRYPEFEKIKSVKIGAHKELIWEKTYHVVIEFTTVFLTKDGKEKKLPIFCSAHSDEPRKNVYTALEFLWNHGFNKGYLTIPHPLFYSEYFKGTFYRGAPGNNLYYYIRKSDFTHIETIVTKAASWFAKLHNIPTAGVQNFNEINSRIKTVYPGINHILSRIENDHPEYLEFFSNFYKKAVREEEEFLEKQNSLWLVHGDAHPENIIRMGKQKIAVIDFTDLCLSDFARDIGTFLQQLEFMCLRKIKDKTYPEKIKKIFLNQYLKERRIKMTDELESRINLYYNWTAMRTATFFLFKDKPEPERAYQIIEKIKNDS